MKGSAFIKISTENDSSYEDIYTVYGVSFLRGSYLKLLGTSAAKDYVKNDSRLLDGVQYIMNTKIKDRTVSVDILIEADTMQVFVQRYEAFINRIKSGLLFLKIPSRYRVFKLVYSNITPKQDYRNKWATFTLSLIEPDPTDRITIG